MKTVYLLIFITSIVFFKTSYAQTTEKFLKLNRIITLDSTKSISFNTNRGIVFTITVPPGVYWKIDNLLFNGDIFAGATPLKDYFRIKVNSVYIPKINAEQSSSEYYGFIRTTPLWVGPNTIISAEIIPASNGQTYTLDIYLSAQEFILE